MNTFGDVKNVEIIVKIKESRELKTPTVISGKRSFTEKYISDKEVVFEYTTRNINFDDDIQIEYDIVRPAGNGGDILIRNGYFVHFISPDDLGPIPKNIIFVIDKSGSMIGHRIEKVREAFEYIINDLDEIDKFNIVYFDTSSDKLFDESKSTALGSEEGLEFVRSLIADGGTNVNDGILTALKEPPHEESQAGIVFMLSDGQTNSGETNWDTIRENVLRANEDRFAIFTFAIGSSAPYADLEKLSVQNNGLARQIFDDSDVKDSVEDFYKSVATPLLWNMAINYTNSKKSIMSGGKMFRGEELVVVGELENPCKDPEPIITGEGVDVTFEDVAILIECTDKTKGALDVAESTEDPMENPSGTPMEIDLEKMFAYLQIRRWNVAVKGAKDAEEANMLKEKIIKQAIKHGFVTKYTSMVVKEASQNPTVAPTPARSYKPSSFKSFQSSYTANSFRPAASSSGLFRSPSISSLSRSPSSFGAAASSSRFSQSHSISSLGRSPSSMELSRKPSISAGIQLASAASSIGLTQLDSPSISSSTIVGARPSLSVGGLSLGSSWQSHYAADRYTSTTSTSTTIPTTAMSTQTPAPNMLSAFYKAMATATLPHRLTDRFYVKCK
mgnify:CR=1 FL=1